ncbi:hypothetical protein BEN47_16715 [Hymenobacter lapidarius]|uniref:Uncharacterized protein n=1 Tax=Hymenobacter lapidarius TaxID=1908237 RepID=A0A1G1SZR1_9BACT|nr:hypothetical protein [Hymenobacter lapidarius]OGX84119.1 hypothetical protein BEN47_16715 [Hymenobacter lapidarius]
MKPPLSFYYVVPGNKRRAELAILEQPPACSVGMLTEVEIIPDPEPLTLKIRVKAEAYEYRIYDLEIDYMMQLADTPESVAAKAKMERVTACYHRDYPGRPLHPKRDPALPAREGSPHWPYTAEKKARKPYTKRVKAA